MAAATISADALGTRESTFLMKCTRQRCHDEHRGDGLLEAQVVVGDHQLHAGQAPGPQALEEGGPEGAILGVAHLHAQHFSLASGRDPGSHHHGPAHHPAPDPGLEVGGIGEHIGELGVAQGPVAELAQVAVELGAYATDLALGDAGVHAQGFDQVVDLASGHPVHVSLHDHGEQGPVDAPPALQQARVEAAGAQLGDGQLDVAGRGGQQPDAVAVALGDAGLGALVGLGADGRAGLGLDELLEDPLQALAHPVGQLAAFERVEELGQVMIGEGHRWSPSS
jgi:hypothetical protein